MDAGDGPGSVVFLFKLVRRSLSRQRREHFFGGRVAGSATEKNGNIKLFLLSFTFCFKIRPVGNEMRILLTTQCHLLILCK